MWKYAICVHRKVLPIVYYKYHTLSESDILQISTKLALNYAYSHNPTNTCIYCIIYALYMHDNAVCSNDNLTSWDKTVL